MMTGVPALTAGRVERWSLAVIGVFTLPVGLQAAFFPESFYDDFPFGRGWVAVDGAYNEHLVRDVGVLYLALVVVTLWAAWSGAGTRPVGVAWVLQGVLHLMYHLGHLDELDTGDQVGLVVTLTLVPVLAVVSLVAGARADEPDRG
jgi:hypothetical protein